MNLEKFYGFMAKWMGSSSWVQITAVLSLHGRYVGTDYAGNRYYKLPPRGGDKHERRIVRYAGNDADASRVPPEWHGWLHHQTNTVPAANNSLRRPWQQPHTPNATGSAQAYRPPGHQSQGGKRKSATGDYIPWTPGQTK